LLRELHNWSQEELAERVGVGPTDIGKVERGGKAITAHLTVKLARALLSTGDQ